MTPSRLALERASASVARAGEHVRVARDELSELECKLRGEQANVWRNAHCDALGDMLMTHADAMTQLVNRSVKRLDALEEMMPWLT